jgi:hypothetical protein
MSWICIVNHRLFRCSGYDHKDGIQLNEDYLKLIGYAVAKEELTMVRQEE